MLAKSQLNRIEVSISKTLIDSNIIDDEFVLINNVMIRKKKSKILMINKLYIKQRFLIV